MPASTIRMKAPMWNRMRPYLRVGDVKHWEE
ncbi:MAG: hypothetical protein Hyperionvirus23_30 [Hyperionvirus sp.]|uniref:Uncharacterized protein n=1 Tax=Hyperionvirus sp. TaxID=2487770 RepID=A0A3G5AEQ4_9VIRU|nr:MAG: hypothetical protein Hyperionvirus23_30 [Hyperionvirus sp.]